MQTTIFHFKIVWGRSTTMRKLGAPSKNNKTPYVIKGRNRRKGHYSHLQFLPLHVISKRIFLKTQFIFPSLEVSTINL